jgi:hypothetical protein
MQARGEVHQLPQQGHVPRRGHLPLHAPLPLLLPGGVVDDLVTATAAAAVRRHVAEGYAGQGVHEPPRMFCLYGTMDRRQTKRPGYDSARQTILRASALAIRCGFVTSSMRNLQVNIKISLSLSIFSFNLNI